MLLCVKVDLMYVKHIHKYEEQELKVVGSTFSCSISGFIFA